METVLVSASLLLSFFGHSNIIYAEERPLIPITISTTSPLWVRLRIHKYAEFYNVSEDVMNAIVKCESNYNHKARHTSLKEDSIGVVQINLKAHTTITKEQAEDIDFSLDFLGKNKDNWKIWTCYNQLATST
jgi:hypothetical protein